MLECCRCKKPIEEVNKNQFVAYNCQKKKEEIFCSYEHLKQWMTEKIIWMSISLLLGFVVMIPFLPDMGPFAFIFFFMPYMIRQGRNLIFSSTGSVFLGVITFLILYLSSATFIYPAFKLYQEISEYVRLNKRYKNDKAYCSHSIYQKKEATKQAERQYGYKDVYYYCPKCGAHLRIQNVAIGKTIVITCPKCKNTFQKTIN